MKALMASAAENVSAKAKPHKATVYCCDRGPDHAPHPRAYRIKMVTLEELALAGFPFVIAGADWSVENGLGSAYT